MPKKQYKPANDFINAIGARPTKESRIHAMKPDGSVGITAWHSDPTNIKHLKREIKAAGHKILRVETRKPQ